MVILKILFVSGTTFNQKYDNSTRQAMTLVHFEVNLSTIMHNFRSCLELHGTCRILIQIIPYYYINPLNMGVHIKYVLYTHHLDCKLIKSERPAEIREYRNLLKIRMYYLESSTWPIRWHLSTERSAEIREYRNLL